MTGLSPESFRGCGVCKCFICKVCDGVTVKRGDPPSLKLRRDEFRLGRGYGARSPPSLRSCGATSGGTMNPEPRESSGREFSGRGDEE